MKMEIAGIEPATKHTRYQLRQIPLLLCTSETWYTITAIDEAYFSSNHAFQKYLACATSANSQQSQTRSIPNSLDLQYNNPNTSQYYSPQSTNLFMSSSNTKRPAAGPSAAGATNQAAAQPPAMSSQMQAVMRVMTGQAERTIAQKLADSNRPTWEQYKKDNEDKLNIEGIDQKKMDEYRKQLDADRESKLARGTNHRNDKDKSKKDKKPKKRKKSKKKKRKRRRECSDSDSYSSYSDYDDDYSSYDSRDKDEKDKRQSPDHDKDSDRDYDRDKDRKKRRKKKHRKRSSRDDSDSDSYYDSEEDSRRRRKKSKRSKKSSKKKKSKDNDGNESDGSHYRLSKFFDDDE